jgi:hypothetical protein
MPQRVCPERFMMPPSKQQRAMPNQRSTVMNQVKNIIGLSILAGSLSLGTAAHAADLSSGLTMKPLQGVSIDVGSKRAAVYFLNDEGQCKLVLTLAETPDLDGSTFAVRRFEASVRPGHATRYNSAEGVALDFACQARAQAMSIDPVAQVAAASIR